PLTPFPTRRSSDLPLDNLVPGPGEATLVTRARERPLPAPFAPRQLVVDLEHVPVGIREVHADRDGVVRDAERIALVLEAQVNILQFVEASHSSGNVVTPDQSILL